VDLDWSVIKRPILSHGPSLANYVLRNFVHNPYNLPSSSRTSLFFFPSITSHHITSPSALFVRLLIYPSISSANQLFPRWIPYPPLLTLSSPASYDLWTFDNCTSVSPLVHSTPPPLTFLVITLQMSISGCLIYQDSPC
jgi:hypothetical protein